VVATNFFYYRHLLILLPGAAVGFAGFMSRQLGANRKTACGVLLLLAGFAVRNEVLTALHPEQILYFGNQQTAARAGLALEDDILADGKLYITSPAALLITEIRYYSKRPDYYVELRPAPWQYARARYDTSILYWNLDELKQHASETAVLLTTPEFTAEMARAGIRAAAAPKHPEVLYLSAD
jgi:hypothetical protein